MESDMRDGAASLRFGILGPVAIWRDRRPVPIPGARARTVLAQLLLRPQATVRTDHLIDALYPGGSPVTARNQIHTGIAKLRGVLGADAALIVTRPHGYLIDTPPASIDAFRFRALVERAREIADDGRDDLVSTLLAEALSLWRGAALEDIVDTDLGCPASVWDELRISATERRITADLRCGRHDVVVPELRRLLTEHPLNERFHAQLMLALYYTGRPCEALDVYSELYRRLAELGGVPGAEIRALQTLILRHDVASSTTWTGGMLPASSRSR